MKSRRMRWAGNVVCRGNRRWYTGFWRENLKKKESLEGLGVDGVIILQKIFKKWDAGIDRFELAQERDRWRALVNAIMTLQVT
jgi:hypothetical protein